MSTMESMATPASPHIQQLVELLAVVSSYEDEAAAVQGAVERSAQALEAEVAAVILGDQVVASIGFPAGRVPAADLIDVAMRRRDWLDIPGSGPSPATTASWGGNHGHLVLARWGEEGAEPGQFRDSPHSIWVDSRGDLYVSEVLGEDRFQKFVRR